MVLALVLAGFGVAAPSASASPDPRGIESRLLELINRGRQERGKSPLALNVALADQVRAHALDMALTDSLNHDGFTDRVRNAGFAGRGACENAAMRYVPWETEDQVAQNLYQQWVDSPPHRACMFDEERPSNVIGVGVAADAAGAFWSTTMQSTASSSPSVSGSTAAPVLRKAAKVKPAKKATPRKRRTVKRRARRR